MHTVNLTFIVYLTNLRGSILMLVCFSSRSIQSVTTKGCTRLTNGDQTSWEGSRRIGQPFLAQRGQRTTPAEVGM